MSSPVPPPEPQQPDQPQPWTGPEPTQPAPGAPVPGSEQYGAPQYGGAPQYPYPTAAPVAPQYQQPSASPAGSRTLAIVALVLSVIGCTSLVGIVLGIVALVKKRGSGDTANTVMAWIAIAVGALWLVAGTVIGIGLFTVWDTCQELGNGTHYVDGVRYTCDF